MPRPNPPRDVLAEEHLAQRIQLERERRGWSYESLARRMTDAGCAINQSGLYKIEQGTPRRRITVDELVGFSKVFGVPVDQLLVDPAIEAAGELAEIYGRYIAITEFLIKAREDVEKRQVEFGNRLPTLCDDTRRLNRCLRAS